jgi:hypothetical protein
MVILLILFLFSGGLLVLLALPLLNNQIRPNGLYGFRVKKTLENPEIWYAVNQHFAQRLLWTGLAVLAASALFYLLPGLSEDQYALAVLVVLLVFLGVGLAQSIGFMRKLPPG